MVFNKSGTLLVNSQLGTHVISILYINMVLYSNKTMTDNYLCYSLNYYKQTKWSPTAIFSHSVMSMNLK